MHSLRVVVVLMALAMCGGIAQAQDAPRRGLVIGYPASVGVLWPINDKLAVRPELSFSVASQDSTTSLAAGVSDRSSGDSSQVGIGMSALWYLRQWDALRTYVSPRFSYGRTSSSLTSTTSITDGTSSSYSTSGSFGLQYALGERFAVFGELGLAFTAISTTSSAGVSVSGSSGVLISTTEDHSHGVGTRSGVGVIFSF